MSHARYCILHMHLHTRRDISHLYTHLHAGAQWQSRRKGNTHTHAEPNVQMIIWCSFLCCRHIPRVLPRPRPLLRPPLPPLPRYCFHSLKSIQRESCASVNFEAVDTHRIRTFFLHTFVVNPCAYCCIISITQNVSFCIPYHSSACMSSSWGDACACAHTHPMYSLPHCISYVSTFFFHLFKW